MTIGKDLLDGPPPTLLPQDPAAAMLDGGSDADSVVRAHPTSSLAWAVLSEQAWNEDRVLESYAFARVGYHRGGTFQQHDATEHRCCITNVGNAIRSDGPPDERTELAVVRGEHRGGASARQRFCGTVLHAVARGTEEVQTVAVDHERHGAPFDESTEVVEQFVSASETGPDVGRGKTFDVDQCRPSPPGVGQRSVDHLDRLCIVDGLRRVVQARRVDDAGPRSACSGGTEASRAHHSATSRNGTDAAFPLVRRHRSPRNPLVDVGGVDCGKDTRIDVARGSDVQADRLDDDASGETAPRLEEQARFERTESDRDCGRQHTAVRFAGGGIDTTGNVDGQHRGVHHGRVVLATESGAIGRVDEKVARRHEDRCTLCVEDRDLGPALLEELGGHTPVGPVVALARKHHHVPAVGAAHEPDGLASNRVSGTAHERVE